MKLVIIEQLQKCCNQEFSLVLRYCFNFQILVLSLFALLAHTNAAPQGPKDAEILDYNVDNIGIGGYKFRCVRFLFLFFWFF